MLQIHRGVGEGLNSGLVNYRTKTDIYSELNRIVELLDSGVITSQMAEELIDIPTKQLEKLIQSSNEKEELYNDFKELGQLVEVGILPKDVHQRLTQLIKEQLIIMQKKDTEPKMFVVGRTKFLGLF
ncbi:hypothetical protein SAMN05880501_103224 [Ureibacillus xyleni]|uniref:Uncharacterized protein n=1 Tax=Ureibacillus xyleni TaxID=614648 RepID=A0A285SC33_9BACL|nr:hypothetical protein [Ureibacillus xyleni]SOC03323.1 hypothetical protein SAMN05880501_103224 [Ureibacillus xyleni]